MTDYPEALHWKVHEERTVYDNRWVKVDLVDVEPPDGSRFEHHVVQRDHVAVARVVNEREEVLTVRSRPVGTRTHWQPCRTGRRACFTAGREAVEETG